MASAYIGNIGQLRKLYKEGSLLSELEVKYNENFGGASDSMKRSWEESTKALLDSLHSKIFDPVGIILELRMPIGDERADAILLSKNERGLFGIVVEMKQWSVLTTTASKLFVNVPGIGKQEHPSAQALNYEGKLNNLHSLGQHYNWESACFMHNLPSEYKATLEDDFDPELSERAPIFGKEDMEQFSEFCKTHLGNSQIGIQEIKNFDSAPYKQTKSFFSIINNNGNQIAQNVTSAIADTGAGLTSEQELLTEEILESAANHEEKIYIVKGSPGSGKSLVAVHLLLKGLAKELETLLALRNNRLMAILRQCLNNCYPGASGATVYSSVPRYQSGLGDRNNNWSGRLVICDESQRFNAINLPVIMQRAPTVVFFYDEEQILNPGEEGTKANFINYAGNIGKTIEKRSLTSFMRCRGGLAYHKWIENLLALDNISNDQLSHLSWRTKYEFDVTSHINQLIDCLKEKREQNKVALVASFTESKGKMNSTFHPDNIRVGSTLSSGFNLYNDINYQIPWLMSPQKDYTPFWLEGHSNKLDMVSSIYGCQGFESDYVGIIWGRDFVWRNDQWIIGNSDIITDNIDGLNSCVRNNPELAIKLLQNRYRIFLTRGMLGTVIYCEDEETRNYLDKILK